MKILVVCQYYYPEPFRITDVCESLVLQGHEVTVLTGLPNYPDGIIPNDYKHGKHRKESHNGVKIIRTFEIPRRRGPIFRFLNYYSFSFSSQRAINALDNDFDIVLVNQLSPVMMANAAIKYKKKHGTKILLYCLDIWPESLVAGGIKRGSMVYKLFKRISARIYKKADKLIVTSQSFSKYFEDEFQIVATEYLPQYAESLFAPEECVKAPNGTIDLMFAGNIGAAQSVKTIIEAANLTKDIENLRWHIVGDGSEIDNLKRLAQRYGLESVIFHGRKPIEEMPKYYAMADAMLVTMQKDQVLSMTLPGKVQTYMAAGKPIIGAIDGETKRIIEESGCGRCCPSEDALKLAKTVSSYQIDESYSFSKNAYQYYRDNFNKIKFIEKIQNILENYVK